LDDDSIELIVKDTFSKLSEDNCTMDFDKYKQMIYKFPDILGWLKVDLNKIKKVNFNNKVKRKALCGGPF
jgi:hypothetical protein